MRVRVTPTSGSPHDATEDLFGQWTLGHGDANGPQAESLVLWGLTPFPAAGNLAWPGRTERRSWVDLLFDTYTTWPCGTLPPTERCINFEVVPVAIYDPELRYRPEPAFGAVVFTPWPNAARKDDVDGQVGESVQVPLAIINTTAQGQKMHCLQLARTTYLGGADGQKQVTGSVGDGITFWGVSIDLLPSVHARGRVEHNADLTFMFVLAYMNDEPVAAIAANGPDFEIASDPKPAFNRLVIRVQPRSGHHLGPGLHHFLCRFCYTTVGAVANQDDVLTQRGLWQHVLGPLTIDEPETDDNHFGAHLVHEPFATYRIELDVRTESAEALDGTWTDLGVATEQLTVSTAGAPADLTPYVQALAPGDGARPFYADYDLRITYNQPYVEAMYQKAGGALVADLFTVGGQRVEPEVIRSRTTLPAISSETAILLDELQSADCVVMDIDSIAGYDETIYRTRLATSTAYEVENSTAAGYPIRSIAGALSPAATVRLRGTSPTSERCRGTKGSRPQRRSARSQRGSDPSPIVRRKTKRGARSGRPTSASQFPRCPSGRRSPCSGRSRVLLRRARSRSLALNRSSHRTAPCSCSNARSRGSYSHPRDVGRW